MCRPLELVRGSRIEGAMYSVLGWFMLALGCVVLLQSVHLLGGTLGTEVRSTADVVLMAVGGVVMYFMMRRAARLRGGSMWIEGQTLLLQGWSGTRTEFAWEPDWRIDRRMRMGVLPGLTVELPIPAGVGLNAYRVQTPRGDVIFQLSEDVAGLSSMGELAAALSAECGGPDAPVRGA